MSSEVEWGNWAPYKGSKPDYSFSEFADMEYEHFRKASQLGKEVIGATDAYDRRNDEIFKATGEKLFNPLRDIPSADDLEEMQAAYRAHVGAGNVDKSRADFQVEWFAQRYDQRLRDLVTKHPNHHSVIQADRSPILDAMETAQASERKAADLAERLGTVDVRQSVPALKYVPILPDIANFGANVATNPKATIAQFWGGFKAQMSNPVEASMNLLGFGAGRANMSVLKTALHNAAANAAIEAIAQPMRQYESKRLGLDYGWDRFFADVSGAAGTGFMLDAAIRGPYRAGITRFGRDVPEGQLFTKHGRGGLLTDAIPQMDPIKPVVREKITPEEYEKAKTGDIDAIESIAKKSGIYDDPSIKGMIDYAKLGGRIDDEMVKRFEAMKIDHGEGMATLRAAIEVGGLGYARMPDPIPQAARALDTAGAAELAPRLAEIDQRLAEAPQSVRQAIRAGIEAGIPEIVDAARKAVSGDLEGMRKAIADAGGEQALTDRVIVHTATNPISVAMALRRSPQVMDSNVSLRTDMMRMARAIAALDEPAFRMVLEGKAHPLAGQIVADMVPPGRHAQVLEQVANFRSMEDAKAAIPDLIPEPSRAPEATGTKVSDPAGPEAKAQIEDLEKAHKAEVDRATEPARKREELESKVETLKGEIAKLEEQQGKLFAIGDEPSRLDPSPEARKARAEAMGFDTSKVWYHGAARSDRIAEAGKFDPKRATSGPMAFFTDDPKVASNYAKGKADTSLNDDGEIAKYFTVSPRDLGDARGRTPYTVEQSWYRLPPEQRADIAAKAKRVGYENPQEATGPLTLHSEGTDASLNGSHFDYILKTEARGNVLTALRIMWHDSGELFGQPEEMMNIWRLAGYPHKISDKTAPWYEAQGVLPVYMKMRNPLDTSDTAALARVGDALDEAFKRDRSRLKEYGADGWDKNSRYTPKEWVKTLRDDIAADKSSFVFTSMPDKVTEQLRVLGYDGILDRGGKMGGAGHDVAIPFDPQQVRSVNADFDPAKANSPKLMAALSDRGKASLDETILSPPEQKLLAKLTERTGLKPEDIAEQRAQGQSFGKKIDAALDKATKFEGAEKAADELAAKRQELRAAERELEQVQLDQARTLQDPALFNAVMRRAALQRQLDVRRAIDDALRLGNRMLPENTRVEVRTDEMVDPASGYRLDASSDMATGDIALASYALNPAGRIGHEGVHTLITKGHVAPEEVKLLAKMARERGLFKDEAKYREAYAGRDSLDALIDEEAAAHAIEARINGTDIGPANTMADRIKQLIKRIKNALDGYGFKTADDVARAIIEGRAAEREARAEWMRNNGETAFAIADTNTGRSMRADLDRLGYYSKALEAAKGLKQAKGTPEQMLAQLKAAGVKDAEIEATSLRSFLDGKTSITRDEIVKHLTQNRVGVNESKYGEQKYVVYGNDGRRIMSGSNPPSEGALAGSTRFAPFRIVEGTGVSVDTKWSNYSLDPSNPTYRETVLHLPPPYEMTKGPNGETVIKRDPRAPTESFTSGHFSEPNIIGHMMTSLNKHEGKPVFTLDQIQSDWGQKLRDGGVRDEAKIAALTSRMAEIQKEFAAQNQELKAAGWPQRGSPLYWARDNAPELAKRIEAAFEAEKLIEAELNTAKAASTGHPLVNTTDQWTITTLRRALRQAAEADAEFIAIPHGDTVLSYNPGDEGGMRGFYGSRTSEGIVPKNLRKLLEKIDKDSAKPALIDKLETPSGMKGSGFSLFPLTEKVKRSVMEEGQALFALSREPLDMSPEARKTRAEQMGFDTNTVWYHGTSKGFDEFSGTTFVASEPQIANVFATKWGEPEGGRVLPVLVKKDLKIKDIANGYEYESNRHLMTEQARSEGYDGIAFKQAGGGETFWTNEVIKPHTELVVFDPTNIRSVNATFDPAEAGSARLLAAFNDNTPPDPLTSDMAVVDRMSSLRELIEACR